MAWTKVSNIRGPTGATGAPGSPGQGVPAGGAAGTLLSKTTATDFDTAWIAAPGGPPSGVAGGDLSGSTYPNPAVAPGKITAAKTAAGATLQQVQAGAAVANLNATGTTWVTAATVGPYTLRGGPVLLMAEISWVVNLPTGTAAFYVQLLRDSTTLMAQGWALTNPGSTVLAVPLPTVTFVDSAPGAGSHTYYAQVQAGGGTTAIKTGAGNNGQLVLMELS